MPDPTPDITSPPGAKGPEGTAPGGQEQSPLRVVPSAEETARMVAAKRAQETAKEEGPGEALREVAGEDQSESTTDLTAGHLAGERIVSNVEIKAINEQLENPNLTPAQRQHWETQLANAQQRAGQVGELQGELSRLSGNLENVIAQKEITTATQEAAEPQPEGGGAESGAGEAVAGKTPAEEPAPEAEAEAPPAQAATGGGGAEEPPGDGPPTTEATQPEPQPEGEEAQQPEAPEMSDEEKFIASLERMSPKRLQKMHSQLETRIAFLERRSEKLTSIADMDRIDTALENLEYQRDLINDVMESRGIEPTGGGGRGGRTTDEERAAAELEARELTDFAIQAEKWTPEQRDANSLSLDASEKALKRKLASNPTQAQREALNKELQNITAKKDALSEVKARKGPEEEKTKKETEAKKISDELQTLQGKVGPVEEIKGIVDALQGEFDSSKAALKKNAEDSKNATDDATRTKLKEEREDIEKRAAEVGKRLKSEKGALEEARKREREEFTLEGRMGVDTLREMSRQEYKKLIYENPTAAAKYLDEVLSSVGSASAVEYERIRQAVINGESIGLEDRAQFSDVFSGNIILGRGRAAGDLEMMQHLLRRYPDMYAYVIDKVTSNNQAIDKIKEAMPSGWEKALRFAKNNPAWLMIILAILAGTAGAVAVATGPGLGVAAGLGGAGAAGVGGHSAWRRR